MLGIAAVVPDMRGETLVTKVLQARKIEVMVSSSGSHVSQQRIGPGMYARQTNRTFYP